MDSIILVYIGAKLLGYTLWSGAGLYLLKRPSVSGAFKFGILRLMLGVAFGASVFMLYHPASSAHLILPYLAIYGPVRWLEWSILGKWQNPSDKLLWSNDWRQNLWRLGGIAVSFGIDLLSPEGMKGMFCVGRCLC